MSWNLIKDFFDIKRLEQQQSELQLTSMDIYIHQAKIEKQLIESEEPEVRPFLAAEFELQRAMNMFLDNMADRYGVYIPHNSPKTMDTIRMARLWAKMAVVKEQN